MESGCWLEIAIGGIYIFCCSSFLVFFFILEQFYIQSKNGPLGAFLGAISPELWSDQLPADKAILLDWEKECDKWSSSDDEILQISHDFLSNYEGEYELGLGATIDWLSGIIKDERKSKQIVEEAVVRAQRYQNKNDIPVIMLKKSD